MTHKGIKTTLVGVTAFVLCAASGMEARAQRTMRGESLLEASVNYPITSPHGIGGSLSYGQYTTSAFWRAGVGLAPHSASPTIARTARYSHVCVQAEWMQRIVSTRSRSLSLYVGGGPFLGYEDIRTTTERLDQLRAKTRSGALLYGLQASLELEIFFTRKVALVLGASLPINFTSKYGNINCQTGAGLRLNM